MQPLRLQLPATSANLGPGFDAVGLALSLFLTVEANEAPQFQIEATGRNAEQVELLDRNLILETYRELAPEAPPLHLRIHNEIPLGMGCGSSAAALLAGVQLANHFGALGLTPQQVLEEACVREGHPDNVAACFHGGMTVSAMHGREVTTATFGQKLDWRLLLALPDASLATEKARALLPATYTRSDAVANIQATALLVAAFAQDRPELLRAATADRIHQPYRSEACPLLPALLPLAGAHGIYSVTLSGAGPSVLLIADRVAPVDRICAEILAAAAPFSVQVVETSAAVRPSVS
jgi:homoserine kinase